jgi:hypothetical protein
MSEINHLKKIYTMLDYVPYDMSPVVYHLHVKKIHLLDFVYIVTEDFRSLCPFLNYYRC